MGKWLNYDSPVITKLNKVTDIMLMNLAYIVCCLPVITIGAAKSAMVNVCFKEEQSVKDFFRAFVREIRTSIPVWIVLLFCGVCLSYSWYISIEHPFPHSGIIQIPLGLITLVYLLVSSQIFLVMGRYECSFMQRFANAALIAAAHPVRSVLISMISVLPYVFFFGDPELFMKLTFVWLLFYFYFEAFLSVRLMQKTYERIEKADTEEEIS